MSMEGGELAVTVTADDVRARNGVTAAEWPDARVAPVLALALLRARAAQSDEGLTGNDAALWAAGVVALTWHMLTATSTGGGGQVKRVRDGDMETEFTTDKAGFGWLDEAYLFIPLLRKTGTVSTLMSVPMVRTDPVCDYADGGNVIFYDPFGNPVTPVSTIGGVTDAEGVPMRSVTFVVTEAGPSVTVSFAPYTILPGSESGIFGLSNIGPIFNSNIAPAQDGTTAVVTLSDDSDGNVQNWAVGDSGEIFFTAVPV